VWTLIPYCQFENIFPAYFRAKITQQIFMSYLGNDEINTRLRFL
jgi:hypothetical protein